ncbi:MAG TPA: hypothetical protein VLG44_00745 [Chlamydiales bacterium]|nr:hypothetical protein [Chlamydiales bacterium]
MTSALDALKKVVIPTTSYNQGSKLYESTSDAASAHIMKVRSTYVVTMEKMVGVCLNGESSNHNPIALVVAYAKELSIKQSLFCEPGLQTHIFTIPNLVNEGVFKIIFKSLPETHEGLHEKRRFIEFLYQQRATVRFSLTTSPEGS